MIKYAVGVLMLSSALVPVQAAAQTAPATNVDQQAQIDALQAQVKAMQAQLEQMQAQLANQQKAVAAVVTSAPTPAVQVTPQLAADKPSWTSSTKIGGKAFLNVSHISQETNGVKQASTGTEADLKRFYVSVDHQFNPMFSANITTDFRYGSGDTAVYVKKAYLQAKLSDAAVFRVGAADLPWVPFVEDLYGNRYVEQVVIDRTKYGTSTDWGVHFFGKAMGGKLSYAVSAVNGAGYKTLARNSDTIDLEGRISFKPVDYLVFGVGGYTGKLGKSNATATTYHRATRLDLVGAYVGKRGRLGVEYFSAKNWGNVATVAEDKTSGWSAFGSYAVTDRIGLFGRYDWVNPNKLTNAALKENYFNLGASYVVTDGLDVALVYKRDRAENGFVPTGNGTIGGVVDGTYDEFGVWSQFKF